MAGISGRVPGAGEPARLLAARESLQATAADGGVVAIVAGEIHDQARLRELLSECGRGLSADGGEAALVAALYEEFGAELVHALDGACALAVWDQRRGHLLLARDRFGEQPLFYAEDGGGLSFDSRPAALVSGPRAEAVDRAAVAALLAGGWIADGRSVIAAVRELPPGHSLTWSAEQGSVVRHYWRLPGGSEPGGESPAEMTAELRRVLGDSVRARLPDSGAATVLLGGDLDSAVLAGLAAESAAATVAVICGADGEATAAAREVAARLGCEQHELSLGSTEVAAQVPALLASASQPLTEVSAIAAQALAAAGGFPGALGPAGGELLRSPGGRLPGGLRGLLGGAKEEKGAPPARRELSRCGLPASTGLRSPYLNRELVELAVTLPAHAGRGRRPPSPLYDLATQLLPAPPRRRAAGLPAPIAEWLRGPLAEPLARQLEGGALVREGLAEREPLLAALRSHRAGEADRSAELWPVLACGCWLEGGGPDGE